jgi:hypothetical protein
MPKYSVVVQYLRTETIEIDAENKAAAVALVKEGCGDKLPQSLSEQIRLAETEGDYFEILSVVLLK